MEESILSPWIRDNGILFANGSRCFAIDPRHRGETSNAEKEGRKEGFVHGGDPNESRKRRNRGGEAKRKARETRKTRGRETRKRLKNRNVSLKRSELLRRGVDQLVNVISRVSDYRSPHIGG